MKLPRETRQRCGAAAWESRNGAEGGKVTVAAEDASSMRGDGIDPTAALMLATVDELARERRENKRLRAENLRLRELLRRRSRRS